MIKKFTIDHVNVPQDRQYRNLGDPGTGTQVREQFRVRHKRGNNDLQLQAGAVIKHLPASVFSASFRFPGLYPSQAGCSSPVHPL